MKKISILTSILFMAAMWNSVVAQISLTAPATPVLTDFTGFQATGCSPTPAAGQLDSKIFAIYGFTGGTGPNTFPDSLTFGDTAFVGDLARGTVTAFIPTIGGMYALDQSGDQCLWVQPTGADFTPGEVIMRIQNNSGVVMTALDVSYDWKYGNDGNRSQSLNFSYSTDSINFTDIANLADTTIALRDSMYYTVSQSTSISGIAVADGGFIYIKWTTNDRNIPGAVGNRDEIGLDNISVAMQTGVVSANVTYDALLTDVNETAGTVTLTISQSTPINCSVDISTADVDATDGSDYTGGTQTITFDGITPSASVTIPILDDILIEPTESFNVIMTNGTTGCVILTPTTASVNILDDDTPVPADVNFTTATATVNEPAGTIDVTIDQTLPRNCTMDVNVVAGTATNLADYTLNNPAVINFDSISTTQILSIPIIDDTNFELPEYFKIQISNVVGNCVLVNSDTMRITITSDDGPALHDIGPLTTIDATGTPDSINVYCKVRGVAYGSNYNVSANGYQFGLADATGTIWVIRTNVNLNYTLTEGDSLDVYGRILLQNGMTRLRPDSIMLVNQGNPIPTTTMVTSFVEDNEADLITIDSVKIIDPAQWTGAGGGFNVNVLTVNNDTLQFRVDNDIDAYAMPVPTCTWLRITGLLGQFDNSNPFTTGYQLLPRYMTDIECIQDLSIIPNIAANAISLYPNPTTQNFVINTNEKVTQVRMYDAVGRCVWTQNTSEKTVQTNALISGIYNVVITTEKGVWSGKLVKE